MLSTRRPDIPNAAARRIARRVAVRAFLSMAVGSVVMLGCTSPLPTSALTSAPSASPGPASGSPSAELRQAECEFLAMALEDAEELQGLRSPFTGEDRALASGIYSRTNARLASVGALVENASRGVGLSDSLTEAYLTVVSVSSQLSTASIAVNPDLRPSVRPGSPDLVLADLALARQTIGSASQELGCP